MADRFPKNQLSRAIVPIQPTALTAAGTTSQATAIDTFGASEVMFEIDISAYTSGTIGVVVNEANVLAMTGETTVPAEQLKFTLFNATGLPIASATTLSAAGKIVIGVLNTKRFLTCDIVATGTTTLTAGSQAKVFSTNNPQI